VQASYFVFEKMKLEGFAGYDDVRLKTAIKVPKAVVGRIIGKGGKTVKDIQQSTGVIIKLPSNAADEADEQDDAVFVAVYGNFITTQVFTYYRCCCCLLFQSHDLEISRLVVYWPAPIQAVAHC